MQSLIVRTALVGVLLVSAGCGGGGSSSSQSADFKTSFSSVVNQLKRTSQSIGVALEHASSQTDAQLATTFHTLAQRWQAQVGKLQTLKPPANLSTTFNTLTAAGQHAGRDLNAIASAAETHSAAAAKQASTALITDVLSAKSASTTITDKLGIK